MSSQQLDFSSYAAFQADDESIDIVPAFDLDLSLPLFSSMGGCIGPIKAGLSCTVPLWLAVLLHERSMAQLSIPDWMNQENLVQIAEYERTNDSLFNDPARLPFHFYEINRRLAPFVTNHSLSSSSSSISSAGSSNFGTCGPAVILLIEDILQIRIDKLRHQFHDLSSKRAVKQQDDLLVTVDGIGAQELAIISGFVTQSFNDFESLQKPRKSDAEGNPSSLLWSSSRPQDTQNPSGNADASKLPSSSHTNLSPHGTGIPLRRRR